LRCRALPLHCHAPVVPKSMLEKYGLLPGNAILAEEKHMALYQARAHARARALHRPRPQQRPPQRRVASAADAPLPLRCCRSWSTTTSRSTSRAVPPRTPSAWRSGCCRSRAPSPTSCVHTRGGLVLRQRHAPHAQWRAAAHRVFARAPCCSSGHMCPPSPNPPYAHSTAPPRGVLSRRHRLRARWAATSSRPRWRAWPRATA
jgi:hypothetical protein